MRAPAKTSTPSRLKATRSRLSCRSCLLLGDLLGRSLLGRSLLGRGLLGRGLLGDGLLSLLGGGFGLAGQLDANQLGGALADRAGLRGDGAESILRQLDGLVHVALGARGRVLEGALAAQPLQGSLAALDQLVIPAGRRLEVALGGLAELLGGEPLSQLG